MQAGCGIQISLNFTAPPNAATSRDIHFSGSPAIATELPGLFPL